MEVTQDQHLPAKNAMCSGRSVKPWLLIEALGIKAVDKPFVVTSICLTLSKNVMRVLRDDAGRKLLFTKVHLNVLLQMSETANMGSLGEVTYTASTKVFSPSVPTALTAETSCFNPFSVDRK